MCCIICIAFVHVRQSLIPGNETNLVIVCDLSMFLNLVCKTFPQTYIYVRQGNWFIVFFLVFSGLV